MIVSPGCSRLYCPISACNASVALRENAISLGLAPTKAATRSRAVRNIAGYSRRAKYELSLFTRSMWR